MKPQPDPLQREPLSRDPLFRTAIQIRRRLQRQHRTPSQPLAEWMSYLAQVHGALSRQYQRIQRAHQLGWHLAAHKLHEALLFQAQRLQAGATELLAFLRQPAVAQQSLPPVTTLLQDLRQLQEEFESFQILHRPARLVVQTPPIVLGEVHLGPFAIELHLSRLSARADSCCFDCVALEPNAAESDSSVTHPHVKDKCLCAGEATTPIAAALKQGRITDAFLLVHSVLQTYNRQSPYVPLEDWEAQRCPECGYSAGRDGFYFCEACDRDVCDHCSSSCDLCDSACCRACLERDPVSRRDCCSSCRSVCRECDRIVDNDSFDPDRSLCPECRAEINNQEEPSTQEQGVSEQPDQPSSMEDRDHDQSDLQQEQPRSIEPVPAGEQA